MIEALRAACVRLLGEPEFRVAAGRVGDLVATEAETSTIVLELEAAAVGTQEPATAS